MKFFCLLLALIQPIAEYLDCDIVYDKEIKSNCQSDKMDLQMYSNPPIASSQAPTYCIYSTGRDTIKSITIGIKIGEINFIHQN